ncbi:MAG TPA: O-antigen ligase family protein [Chitinophagaceae bacterium]|nr:O-antigen ligase family protein [Chitinophagaceae bacterium]
MSANSLKYKLGSATGVTILAIVSLMMAWLSASHQYSIVPLVAAGGIATLFIVIATFMNPFHGFILNLAICFLIYLPQRILGLDYSLAILWEVHLVICFISGLFSLKGSRMSAENAFLFKSPITILLIVYFLYVLAQYFNPNVAHALGWVLFIRRAIILIIIFFAAFYILDSFSKIQKFFYFFFIITFITTLYGYWQENFGLPPWDLAIVNSSSESYHLHVQWGLVRKFSFLDVVTFPMLLNLGALLLVVFALFEKKQKKILLILTAAGIMLLGATFSGTRSASYIFPAGLFLYSLANMNKPKNLLIFGGVVALILILMVLPIHRFNTLNRFRSSFTTDDASLQVRDINRARIQPYIWSHPFGGGLLTTGSNGERMYPDHPLAKFPPDSGLLATALEKGWIGLALDMLLFLMIMIEGIRRYFRTPQESFRKYYLAITCGVFSLVIGEYAQIVIFQIPICVFFLSAAAIIIRLKLLEKKPETLLI